MLSKGRGRRPAKAVVSIAIVATCSALFSLIYVHSSRLVSVIALTHQVTQGEVIGASDLRQVDVALAGGVSSVPVSDANLVIGKPAAVTLLAGTLLSPSDVGGARTLATGQSVVGVDLKPGMLPASGVEPGESVLVVLTGPAGSPVSTGGATGQSGKQTSGESAGLTAATVVAVNSSPDNSGSGDVVVSVQVPLASASSSPVGLRRARRHSSRSAVRHEACHTHRFGRRRMRRDPTVTIISVCSAKGSPGVTTLACALGAVWPAERRVMVAECDPSGGDIAARFGLSAKRGMTSLILEARRSVSMTRSNWTTTSRLFLAVSKSWRVQRVLEHPRRWTQNCRTAWFA